MAKVMISLPDELLARLDRRAKSEGDTRSGYLRTLAERELAGEAKLRAQRVDELLSEPGRYGGGGADHVRQARDRR